MLRLVQGRCTADTAFRDVIRIGGQVLVHPVVGILTGQRIRREETCAFRIGPRRVGIFCIPPNEKGQAPPARRLAQTVGGISALLPRGFPRVPVSHSAFASGSRVSRKEPPEEERSPFSHGFSVGGSRTGRAATPAPGSSRGGCGPRHCSAACNAHRPARPRWRWPAQPGSLRRT